MYSTHELATDFAWTGILHTDKERQKAREFWLGHLERHLVVIEARIEANKYINGAYSVVDPYLLVIMGWVELTALSLESYSDIQRYLAMMYDRSTVRMIFELERLVIS